MKEQLIIKSIRYLRWSALALLAGALAGAAATLFLILLQWATETREVNPDLILLLPLAGLMIGFLYHYYGREVAAGNNLILEEIHNPKKVIPIRMAPLILLGTVMTHLFGGSAGREGTAVQMGGSLADQLSSLFQIEPDERRILLAAGMGAGFGAAIGAPLAGAVFGTEVIRIGRLRFFAWFECLVASFTGYFVTLLAGAPHSAYPRLTGVGYEWRTLLLAILFGAFCGGVAFCFSRAIRGVEAFSKKVVRHPPLKPMLGGLLLLLLYRVEGSYRFAGLGIPVIRDALARPSELQVPLLKAILTAITLGSGFKGGEFIPLVFIGTTLGSFLSPLVNVSTPVLAALGFSAVFAGASNTPIACAIMAMEIFGPEIGGYAFAACLSSYYFSGYQGIYPSQRVAERKHDPFIALWKYLGGWLRRF